MKKIGDIIVEVWDISDTSAQENTSSPKKGYSPTYSQGWDRIFGDKKEKDTRAN